MGKWASWVTLGLIISGCGGSGSETPPPVEPIGGSQNLRPAPLSESRTAKPSVEGEEPRKDPIEAEEEERVKRQKSGPDPKSGPYSR
jgi:hypothetical protein